MIQDIAPHRLRNEYHPERRPDRNSIFLAFNGPKDMLVLVHYKPEQDSGNTNIAAGSNRGKKGSAAATDAGGTAGQISLLRGSELKDGVPWNSTYLFSVDGDEYYLLPEGYNTDPNECRFVKIRDLRGRALLPKHELFALHTARQIADWYKDNKFCGTCGAKTIHSETERALKCPDCGRTIYPRIQPAVIIGITHGDEIVITRYSDRPLAYDALVAGFTEIGETLEETVAREAMEETGLKVTNIRYYRSQPWAVSDDLLAGFFCDVEGSTEIHIDPSELKTAVWTRREDIQGQPDDYSLTNEMMMVFKAGKEPR